MFQELIKIAEEVYIIDRPLGIKLGKCLESLGKKVAEHNKESKEMYVKIKRLESQIKSLEANMRRRMH
jgi:peptidoglycan hydrolase CwlO-like protein